MKIKKKLFRIEDLIFTMGLTSSMVILCLKNISFLNLAIILLIIFYILNLICGVNLSVKEIDVHYLLISFLVIISTLGAIYNNWGESWKRAALFNVLFYIIYAALCCFQGMFSKKSINAFREGLKISICVQAMWGTIQYILWEGYRVDINTIFFTDILSMVNEASQFKFGELNISGLAWHPINMAPTLILGYCLFNKWYTKGILIISALFTNNSTVLIGVTVCLILDLYFNFYRKRIVLKRSTVIAFLSIVFIISLIVYKTDIVEKIFSSFTYLSGRITGNFDDGGSADAHMRYYTSIPQVIEMSSAYQILFGYGEGTSGYTMGILFGQYTHLKSWVVESDFVNILINKGIIGFALFYYWLIKIAIKGKRIDNKYFICIFSMIICGITYNVQFDWVLIVEIIMSLSIRLNMNFFENTQKRNIFVSDEKYQNTL